MENCLLNSAGTSKYLCMYPLRNNSSILQSLQHCLDNVLFSLNKWQQVWWKFLMMMILKV